MRIREYYVNIPFDFKDTQGVSVVPSKGVRGDDIRYPCQLFLDQATNTGYVIVDAKKRLVKAGHISKAEDENLQDFKFSLRDELKRIIEEYQVDTVWHEEVYLQANVHTTEVLYYLKHMIQDLSFELNDTIKVYGLDHSKWKSLLAKPVKFQAKNGEDKKEVLKYVHAVYPLLDFPEDTVDALGMMIAVVWKQTAKPLYYNAHINKKLPINVEVLIQKVGTDIDEIIQKKGVRFTRKFEKNGKVEFAYRTDYDLLMNCRYILSFKDTVCYADISSDKKIGMIYLHYGIKPSDIKEGDRLIVLASRKK